MNAFDEQERHWIMESQKDPDAFKHLFNKYYNRIFNYVLRRTCNSTIAQDVTANTFLHALDNIRRYQWRGVPFSAWLYRIATNEINQAYRRKKRTVFLKPEHMIHLKSESASDGELLAAEEAIARNRQFQRIHSMIKSLKWKYQTVLTLRYFEDLSIREITQVLGISENTVKTHIRRGLNQLKERL